MDYKGYDCPVCHEQFKDGEDVVVCPECGTPHHRACFEANGACANADKHKEHYSWSEPNAGQQGTDADGVPCAQCGYKNKKDALFCSHCGTPLTAAGAYPPPNGGQNTSNPYGRSPFGGAAPGVPPVMFDPMAGVNPDDEFADNVKASELAAVVQASTPYYMTVFNRIRQFGSSRFNFSAFLFSGGWMLYRKQYLLGAVITVLVFATTVLSNVYYNNFYDTYISIAKSLGGNPSMFSVVEQAVNLPVQEFIAFFLSPVMELLRFIIMLISGIVGNRLYYKHCVKKVKTTKARVETPAEAEIVYQKTGGVNKAIVIVLLVTFMISNLAVAFYTSGAM